MNVAWTPAPVLIAGPCALEGDPVNLAIAERLAELATQLALRIVYKGSFDKANRSHPDAPRGPGLQEGLRALERVRDASGLPVLTDVHEVGQVKAVAEVVDAIQIPAFLCRQTDLLVAAGASGRPVNVKKGQWMAPEDMRVAAEKVRKGGNAGLAVTERGTMFGYGDLIVDMRNFQKMREATGAPVFFDGTHAVQRPGRGPNGESGGDPGHTVALLLAAAAAGADGFYLETHPAPASAPSDAATMVPLDTLEDTLRRILDVREAARGRVTAEV